MNYTISEIELLGLNQLTQEQFAQGLDAFNGFVTDFGRPWIEDFFHGARSPSYVLYILKLWQQWSIVRPLIGSNELHGRWKWGIHEHGIKAEIAVVATVLESGGRVELAPSIAGRVPDFRFTSDTHWVYSEVSARGISQVVAGGQAVLTQVATAAAQAVRNKHGKVAILRDLRNGELDELVNWLRSVPSSEPAYLRDLAAFYADDLNAPTNDDDPIARLVPLPHFFATHMQLSGSHASVKGTACLAISDTAAQEALETEASQLPRDYPGVIWLDVSRVPEGIKGWSPLIERRFQRTINTRISGVVIFSSVLDGNQGLSTEWRLLLNPYARNPILAPELQLLQCVVSRPE
jgi:hypothetical protein